MKPATFKWTLNGLGMATTLVVVALAYAFIFRPMDQESKQLRSAVRADSDFLAGADKIRARNRELKGSLAETEGLIAGIKRRIPESPQQADFLAQLAEAAEESEVEIVDFRPATAIEQDKHYELTIRVSAIGKYAAICRFLDRLETLPRLCVIMGMEIDAHDLAAEVYPLDLTLQVFYSAAHPTVAQAAENGNG